MRVGIVIVHTWSSAHGIHGVKQVIEKFFVGGVRLVILVCVHDADDECDISGGDALIVSVAGVMSATSLDEFWKYGKGCELDRFHGVVDLLDCGSSEGAVVANCKIEI